MKEWIKNLITHGTAAGGGYYMGTRTAKNGAKNSLFSSWIPRIIVAYGVTYFAINAPSEIKEMVITSSKNDKEYRLQENNNAMRLDTTAIGNEYNIDKKNGIYTKNNEKKYAQETKREFDDIRSITERQKQQLNNIERKLDGIDKTIREKNESTNVQSPVYNKAPANRTPARRTPAPMTRITPFNTYLAIDKSDQKFYLYKNHKLVKQGPMIYNGSGSPRNGLYKVQDKSRRGGMLYPGFMRLDGAIGISGAGSVNQYEQPIDLHWNNTRSGVRVQNDDFVYLYNNMVPGTKVEVRY